MRSTGWMLRVLLNDREVALPLVGSRAQLEPPDESIGRILLMQLF